MSYQTLYTLYTGQPIPSAQWNAMRDNQEWVAAPPMCNLTRTTRWNVTGDRYGPFTATVVDTHGFWDPDTAPEKATVPTGAAGTYLITGWHQNSSTSISNPDGGPIAPGTSAMMPFLIGGSGTASMSIESRAIESPYSFALLYPLVAGDSIVLKMNVTPVAAFGLMLQWMRP